MATPGGLNHLREVRMSHCDTEFAAPIIDIPELFELPALHSFRGHKLGFTKFDTPRQLPRFSPLKELSLTQSLVDAGGIKEILCTCPDLETLAIERSRTTFGDGEDNESTSMT